MIGSLERTFYTFKCRFILRRRTGTKALADIKEKKVLLVAPGQAREVHPITAAAPHSGVFLHVRPCSSLGTRLDAPVCAPKSALVDRS
jgi:hypothetical protein